MSINDLSEPLKLCLNQLLSLSKEWLGSSYELKKARDTILKCDSHS